MEGLELAIDIAGGVTKLAGLLGIHQSAVSNWKTRGVPVDKAKAIEKALNGAVQRHDLRPDIFDAPPKRRSK